MKRYLFFPLLVAALGCPRQATVQPPATPEPEPVQVVAKTILVVAEATGVFQDIVIVSDLDGPTTERLLDIALSINRAGLQASQATRTVVDLGAVEREDLWALLQPIADAVDQVLAMEINDPSARLRLHAAMALVSTSLDLTRIALGRN